MSQSIKKRLARLIDRTTQSASGIVFVTLIEPGQYEVRHQNHAKGFTESVTVYKTEAEAQKAIDEIRVTGDHILFWDIIGVDDE